MYISPVSAFKDANFYTAQAFKGKALSPIRKEAKEGDVFVSGKKAGAPANTLRALSLALILTTTLTACNLKVEKPQNIPQDPAINLVPPSETEEPEKNFEGSIRSYEGEDGAKITEYINANDKLALKITIKNDVPALAEFYDSEEKLSKVYDFLSQMLVVLKPGGEKIDFVAGYIEGAQELVKMNEAGDTPVWRARNLVNGEFKDIEQLDKDGKMMSKPDKKTLKEVKKSTKEFFPQGQQMPLGPSALV